jgi:hypothetical protein
MSQQQLLETVVPVLKSVGIDYMITGSIASSLQGEPRSTHDIDLVVVVPPQAIAPLLAAFSSPDFLLQEAAIRDALRHQSMFNLLSLADGEKVDFWILTQEPFDQSRFARRKTVLIGGNTYQVSAPEDTILAKLRWAQLSGGSTKQFKDALRVFEVQGRALDCSYLDDWANRLHVEDLWQQIQAEGKIV